MSESIDAEKKQSSQTSKFTEFNLEECQEIFNAIEAFVEKDDQEGLQAYLIREVPDFVAANLVNLALSESFSINFPKNSQEQILTELIRYAANHVSQQEICRMLRDVEQFYQERSGSGKSNGLTFGNFKQIFLSFSASEDRLGIVEQALEQYNSHEEDSFSENQEVDIDLDKHFHRQDKKIQSSVHLSAEYSSDSDEDEVIEKEIKKSQEISRSKYVDLKSSKFAKISSDKNESVYQYRHFEEFKQINTVKVSAHTTALPQLIKMPKLGEDIKEKKQKYEKIWWPKKARSFDAAFMDTVAGNFRALINTNGAYPKVRWTVSKEGLPYVFSENVAGFQTLFDIETHQKGATKQKLLSRDYKASGEFIVLNLFLGEADALITNIAFGSCGDMMTVDNDAGFSHVNQPNIIRFDYSEQDIRSLPFLDNYEFAHFHNILSQMKTNASSFFDRDFSENVHFLHEKHSTILKILLLPTAFVAKFVDCYANEKNTPEKVIAVKEALAGVGKDWLFATIRNNSDFRKYLFSETAKQDVDIFVRHLTNLRTMSKKYLIELYPDLLSEIRNKFNSICASFIGESVINSPASFHYHRDKSPKDKKQDITPSPELAPASTSSQHSQQGLS